jgi:hypothetical protein
MLCDGRRADVTGELRYCRDDPYAVAATFRVGTEAGVEWLFARDLLMEGLLGHAGDGDVRIAPDDADADSATIELRGPERSVVLAVATACLTEFLTATYAVVGVGEEHRAFDIDRELVVLLANDWF